MTATRPPTIFDLPGVEWTFVSRRLASARLTLLTLFTIVVVIVLAVTALVVEQAWVFIPAGLALAGAVWLGIVVVRQVRVMGYAERDDDLLVRHGILFRHLVVVPYGRMQFVDVEVGPVDRLFGIASVTLHTASPAAVAAISGLRPDQAARLRDRLTARGEARLAGL
jgi:membrane protein YdbS with pleckstrin-like domain